MLFTCPSGERKKHPEGLIKQLFGTGLEYSSLSVAKEPHIKGNIKTKEVKGVKRLIINPH
jgi:hypothetical protein